jgi:DNA uptake protein ComE-like DNA-binding protein
MNKEIDFYLSKSSKRGILILSFLTLCVIYFPRVYFYFKPKEQISIQSFPSKKWESEHKSYSKFEYKKSNYRKNRAKFSIPKRKFDPNNYSQKDWIQLGLSIKQANVILKFTERGIYSNEDLKKIFVISDELFFLIKDSTFYPERKNDSFLDYTKTQKEESKKELLQLNLASEEEFLTLKGVGPFFAKQIIKKRNELGGFVSKEQLLEVWKMDEEKFLIIKDQIIVDQSLIRKISLNTVSIDELKIHPYIRWNIANSIIKMREQKNGFKSIDEIKESVLINEELFEKLKPYLSL